MWLWLEKPAVFPLLLFPAAQKLKKVILFDPKLFFITQSSAQYL